MRSRKKQPPPEVITVEPISVTVIKEEMIPLPKRAPSKLPAQSHGELSDPSSSLVAATESDNLCPACTRLARLYPQKIGKLTFYFCANCIDVGYKAKSIFNLFFG